MRKKSRTSSQIRIERIQSRMTEVISLVIQNELKDPSISPLASVLRVNVTKDLRYAKVFITVMGTDEEREATIIGLEKAKGYIRSRLASAVDTHTVPELTFVNDTSIEYAAYISKRLKEVMGNSENEN